MIFGSIGLSAIIGTSLQFIWGFINNLQLITHTPLLKVPYTAIILSFLKIIFDIVNFDVFNTESNLKGMFHLKDADDYPEYDEYFSFMGYDNTNFLYIVGFPIFVLYFYIWLIPFYFIL